MECPKCKATDHDPGAKFCHRCGTSLQQQSFVYNGLAFTEVLQERKSTFYIVICHTEVMSSNTIKDVHKWHLHRKKPLAGVAYHYLIDKNGKVERGRPYDTKGAVNPNYNSNSIFICFCGDLTKQKLTDEQLSVDPSMLLLILTWEYENIAIKFFDELEGYEGEPMLEENKDLIREELSGTLDWFQYKIRHVYRTSEEEDFFNYLDGECRDFGLPFKIR